VHSTDGVSCKWMGSPTVRVRAAVLCDGAAASVEAATGFRAGTNTQRTPSTASSIASTPCRCGWRPPFCRWVLLRCCVTTADVLARRVRWWHIHCATRDLLAPWFRAQPRRSGETSSAASSPSLLRCTTCGTTRACRRW
jgi:hypothetical protein